MCNVYLHHVLVHHMQFTRLSFMRFIHLNVIRSGHVSDEEHNKCKQGKALKCLPLFRCTSVQTLSFINTSLMPISKACTILKGWHTTLVPFLQVDCLASPFSPLRLPLFLFASLHLVLFKGCMLFWFPLARGTGDD